MFYVEILANYYSKLDMNDIPEFVQRKARIALFDYLTVLLAGKYHSTMYDIVLRYIGDKQEKEESTILGTTYKKSAQTSALAMGIISHGTELDDGHRYGTCHPSAAVIPAVLAEGERFKCNFGQIVKAVIIGYECMLRVASSINPSHLKKGFHSTGTCGTFGAAAAAASLRLFDNYQMANCISISALQSAGFQEMLHGHPEIKALQPGRAAQSGILSAELTSLGAKAPMSILEGDHGWLRGMTNKFREEDLLGGLGIHWEITRTYTKLYPTCRHCHTAIDIALNMYNKGYNLKNIEIIILETYGIGIREVGIIKVPENFEEALFSVSFAVAVALKYGTVSIKTIKNSLDDKEVLDFAKKIKIVESKNMNKKYPEERGAKISIKTSDGNMEILQQALPKGEYETPLKEKEYLQKAEGILENHAKLYDLSNLWDIVVEMPFIDVKYQMIIDIIQGKR